MRGRDKIIKLLPQHQKNTGTVAQEFNFDEILTGSENKPVYNAVARSHVKAAMEGYNAVCFAYGQTASGKTFTLVCFPYSNELILISTMSFLVWRRRTTWYHTPRSERRLRPHPAHTFS